MANYTIPNVYVNTRDKSTSTNVVKTVMPLHRPMIPGFAAKGEIGVPKWGDMATHVRTFGSEIFSASSDYAKTLTYHYLNLVAKNQRFWFLRLPDGSDTLGFAVFAIAKTVSAAPVYSVDLAEGVDHSTILKDASGNNETKDQTQFTFVIYPVSSANTLTVDAVSKYFGLDPKTAAGNLYLMFSCIGTSPGNYMTRNAISLDVTTPATDSITVINRINAPLVRMYPRYCTDDSFSYLATQMNGTNYNFSSVQNIYGSTSVEFCPTMEDVSDPDTSESYGWQDVIETAYTSSSSGYLLDYDFKLNVYGGTPLDQRGNVFNGTFALCMRLLNEYNTAAGNGAATITASTMTKEDYRSINRINPFTGQDITGVTYAVQPYADSSSVGVTAKFGQYNNIFAYDTDAISKAEAVTDANIDTAVGNFFTVNTGNLTNISDPFAVPFNFMYDMAYSLSTKTALANVLDVRDDVKIDFVTDTYMGDNKDNAGAIPKWMAPRAPVYKANDLAATLSSLMTVGSTVTLHGVDSEFSTPSYSSEIYTQSGTMTVAGNRRVTIPINYERLKMRCAFYSGPTVTGSPKGRPNNVLSSFDSLSWVPKDNDQKQLIWGKGANYATYADVNTLFLPDIRTSYSNDTSLLSSGTFTDLLMMVKGIVRDTWTYFVGLEQSVSLLTTDIETAIDTACFNAFGTYLTTKTTVELQDSNTENDYTAMVYTECLGNMPDRVWKTILTPIRNTASTSTTTA